MTSQVRVVEAIASFLVVGSIWDEVQLCSWLQLDMLGKERYVWVSCRQVCKRMAPALHHLKQDCHSRLKVNQSLNSSSWGMPDSAC